MAGKIAKRLSSAVLAALLLSASVPFVAVATPSSEIEAELSVVQEQLLGMYDSAEMVSEQLNETRYLLGETEKSITENMLMVEEKTAELAEAKTNLSEIVSENYKGGYISLVSLIVGSQSIEDVISRIYYANKVSVKQQEAIETVKTITAELEEKRVELVEQEQVQKELLTQQESLQNELNQAIIDTEAYYNGLSVQLQEALAAEEAARQEALRAAAEAAAREEEEARRAAEEAAAQEAAAAAAAAEAAAQQQETTTTTTTVEVITAPANEPITLPDPPSTTETDSSTPGTTTTTTTETVTVVSDGGTIDPGVASIVVNAAYSQLGVSYVYGACEPGVAFDCSGLVSWCYAQAGYSLPHYSGALSAYCNKPASQAVAGDILWRPGHVGICIGGGTTIEAFNPSRGVTYGTVSSFVTAGSPAA